jgi:hypothetical protein
VARIAPRACAPRDVPRLVNDGVLAGRPGQPLRALTQVKSWGFEEFHIMPEGAKLLAFFRKRIG